MRENTVRLNVVNENKVSVKERDTEFDYLIGIEFTKHWTMNELTQLQKSLRNIPAGTKDRLSIVHKDIVK